MCGLFGWALDAHHRQDRQTLARMTDAMQHRGPDGSGYWLRDTADERHQIGLGHRRLSIIDIGGGVQPMTSADGRFTLVFNGEIYNYVELREQLAAHGHAFRTQSDTEVLIESFRRWGLDAICRFRGMFAFALWDEAEERLVLARDPFGKKPLFLSEQRGGLLFASEIEPLTLFPGFTRAFNHDALGPYLLNRYVPGPATFFRGVNKLPPGHHAVWRKGRLVVARYFTPPIVSENPDIASFEDAVAMFEDVFYESVRIRMRSDAPFGAYLSGGLDSSAIVAAMTRHLTGRLRTFSVGFPQAAYSELDHASAVAGRFDTQHSELVVEPDAFMKQWPTATLRRGAPVTEASDIPILMLSEMAAGSVKMVLTGEGADEFMGGYPKHRAEPWVELYQRLMPAAVHRQVVSPLLRALPYGMRRVKTVALAAGERDLAHRMQAWFGGMSVAEHDEILGRRDAGGLRDGFQFSSRSKSHLRRTLFFDQTSWLPDNLLERGDRMMMAASVEGRMPFMDTELAALVARFPDRFLIGGKGGKTVLRSAMAKVLPVNILNRKKVGFRVPFGDWVRGPHRDFARDLLTSAVSGVSLLCNRQRLAVLLAEHLDGRQNHERVLWSLMSLELFLRQFKPAGLDEASAPSTTLPEPVPA